MNKAILIAAAILSGYSILAQQTATATHEFVIDGLVEKNTVITMDSLRTYPTVWLDSLVIRNHKGERKSALKNLKVIPVHVFLKNIKIQVENPKQLSEYYLVFEAVDHYKVVYSWNEIFNHQTGQEIYIILEKDGKRMDESVDSITIISPTDFMTGRRYVKGLSRITIKRTE